MWRPFRSTCRRSDVRRQTDKQAASAHHASAQLQPQLGRGARRWRAQKQPTSQQVLNPKYSSIPHICSSFEREGFSWRFLEKIPLSQLDKLVSIVRDRLCGLSLEASLVRNDRIHHIDPEEDLNKVYYAAKQQLQQVRLYFASTCALYVIFLKVDEEVLKRKKAIMEESFRRNCKKIGDPDFQYDVEVDFDTGAIESADWDSGDDVDNEFWRHSRTWSNIVTVLPSRVVQVFSCCFSCNISSIFLRAAPYLRL